MEVRKTRDPITGFKDKIVSAKLATAEELKEMDKAVRKEVDAAVAAAHADAMPPLDLLYTDIYDEDTPDQLIRTARFDTWLKPKALSSAKAVAQSQ